MKKILFFAITIFCGASLLFIQHLNAQTPIVRAIESNNAASDSKVTINQDARIDSRLNAYINRIDPTAPYTGPGYRVQVFSSNNFKTAKTDAYNIEKQLKSVFPEQQVYVTYASPFWKVRVGNFRTADEAQKLRSEIINLFPALRKDTYAVRENRVKID